MFHQYEEVNFSYVEEIEITLKSQEQNDILIGFHV